MSSDADQHARAQQFITLLMEGEDVLLSRVLECAGHACEAGSLLPGRMFGAALALLTYRTIRRLQEQLKDEQGQPLPPGEITGVFVDSVSNLVMDDFGLVSLAIAPEHLQFLCEKVQNEDGEVAHQLRELLSQAKRLWLSHQKEPKAEEIQ